MPAWSLSGSILLAVAAPPVGGGKASVSRSSMSATKPVVRVIDAVRTMAYRLPAATLSTTDRSRLTRDRRLDRVLSPAKLAIADPQAVSVSNALRDRSARKGGPLSRGLEWRLDGNGSDLGFGGGLKRIVDAVLDD